MQTFEIPERNVWVEAPFLALSPNIDWGCNIHIRAHELVEIGEGAHIGNNLTVNCEKLFLGRNFYYEPTDNAGLTIGGGGSNFPYATVSVGHGCVAHSGHWNCARPININNNVGISHRVSLLTHGFWGDYTKGFPRKFGPITIGSGTILGWEACVLPDVVIARDVTVGARALVTQDLTEERGVYTGNPAVLKKVIPLQERNKERVMEVIMDWNNLMSFYDAPNSTVAYHPPHTLVIDRLCLDLDSLQSWGEDSEVSDAFRDFLRRYGIRFHSSRGFKFNLPRKQKKPIV